MLRKSILVVLLTVVVASPMAFVKAAPLLTASAPERAGSQVTGGAPTTHDACRRGDETCEAL